MSNKQSFKLEKYTNPHILKIAKSLV